MISKIETGIKKEGLVEPVLKNKRKIALLFLKIVEETVKENNDDSIEIKSEIIYNRKR